MKYILLILVSLFCFSLCEPKPKRSLIGEEDTMSMKKALLECLTQSNTASDELKNFVRQQLKTDLKEDIMLSSFTVNQSNDNNRQAIKKCKRLSFEKTIQKKLNEAPKDE